MTAICVICGKEFEQVGSSHRKTCSEECRKQMQRETSLKVYEERRKKLASGEIPGRAMPKSRPKPKPLIVSRNERLPKICRKCSYYYSNAFGGICDYLYYAGKTRGISVEECAELGPESKFKPRPPKKPGPKPKEGG